jgi:ABC-2 type transport system ATP-binding protein
MSEEVIQVQNLTRRYHTLLAVDQISFQVLEGQIFGLLGPNGAGKSTTIKMLTTLLPPTSGTAKIKGFDIVKEPARVRASIGYVPQILSADGDLTGHENLVLSGKLYGLPRLLLRKRIQQVLEFMGLSEHANQLVSEYSGGMIRRLEIAQAVLHEPAVLFLDEPTVGLDPSARQSLWRSIQDWCSHFGTTFLLTTHDMEEADKLCDRVAFMHLGHLVTIDTPQNLKATIGVHATLDDVFIQLTGASVSEGGDFKHARETRETLSRLE